MPVSDCTSQNKRWRAGVDMIDHSVVQLGASLQLTHRTSHSPPTRHPGYQAPASNMNSTCARQHNGQPSGPSASEEHNRSLNARAMATLRPTSTSAADEPPAATSRSLVHSLRRNVRATISTNSSSRAHGCLQSDRTRPSCRMLQPCRCSVRFTAPGSPAKPRSPSNDVALLTLRAIMSTSRAAATTCTSSSLAVASHTSRLCSS
mmetsp:Transcript_27557/g.95276  ORF Transcript_27557/g.95276 Transcript_27557/m.95276 type:complete len:205 (+) Transcript_27557:4554-5168(+)